MAKAQRINFDDLKARADFRAVLVHYGLALVGQGDQAKVLCPFHDDERPSCSVNLAKGLWHCFRGCGAGNVLDFVHKMETRDGATVSLRQAGLRLAEISGLNLGTPMAVSGRPEPRRASSAKETAHSRSNGQNGSSGRSKRCGEAMETEPTVNKPLGFRLTLEPDHPYLRERGISPDVLARFGLGFCAYGGMTGRLCIPIENAEGKLVAYAGRWAGEPADLPEGEEKYKLPKGFHKSVELFNLHRVKACRHLYLVEGYFGAMRLHAERVPAVALMGSSISDAQVALLREHCPALRHVSVMLDGDEAGRNASEAVASRLARHWWTRIVALPEGTQPDTVELEVLSGLLGRRER